MVREQRGVFSGLDRSGNLRSGGHGFSGGGHHARAQSRCFGWQFRLGFGNRCDRSAQDHDHRLRAHRGGESRYRSCAHYGDFADDRRVRPWSFGRLSQYQHARLSGIPGGHAYGASAPERPDGPVQQHRIHFGSDLWRCLGVDVLDAVGVSVHGSCDGRRHGVGIRLSRGVASRARGRGQDGRAFGHGRRCPHDPARP